MCQERGVDYIIECFLDTAKQRILNLHLSCYKGSVGDDWLFSLLLFLHRMSQSATMMSVWATAWGRRRLSVRILLLSNSFFSSLSSLLSRISPRRAWRNAMPVLGEAANTRFHIGCNNSTCKHVSREGHLGVSS